MFQGYQNKNTVIDFINSKNIYQNIYHFSEDGYYEKIHEVAYIYHPLNYNDDDIYLATEVFKDNFFYEYYNFIDKAFDFVITYIQNRYPQYKVKFY